MNKYRKFLSLLLALMFILSGLPVEIKAFAASITLSAEYNKSTGKHEISYPETIAPDEVVVKFHDPKGDLTEITYTNTGENTYDYSQGRVTVSMALDPDYIYDISLDVYRSGVAEPFYHGEAYYLADMTFTGESFNTLTPPGNGLEDMHPVLEPTGSTKGSAVLVKSGDSAKIKLNWKVPTIYNKEYNPADPLSKKIINFTDSLAREFLAGVDAEGEPIPIEKSCFQINMRVGKGSRDRTLEFNTDYDVNNDMIIKEHSDLFVSGFDNGTITNAKNTLSLELDSNQGIEPGTEYEFTHIRVMLRGLDFKQIINTKLLTGQSNEFPVENKDIAFENKYIGSDLGLDLSSIYTPMQIEISKVDTDKVEVRFRKIVNGQYPELHYQVQYASVLNDFKTTDKWVKIPASTLTTSDDYGSEIVTIHITGQTNPEMYFRVVIYDNSSKNPLSSSLAVNLQDLAVDSGKPPVPKEIRAEPIYAGRGEVKIPNTVQTTEIPLNDLNLSFEKPLAWRTKPWNDIMDDPVLPSDIVFHILLSTLLPDAPETTNTEKNTINIGDPLRKIYLPTKQKRVLVLSKNDFVEDPNNPNRIICSIPGKELFYDYVSGSSIENENNEDPSKDGTSGDYPDFLIPNTSYFMQIFSSRLEDNDEIYEKVWAKGLPNELSNKLSYKSPIISFTTWPLTETPVPMPDISLQIEPEPFIDPVTGEITLVGIRVKCPHLLTNVDWLRYANADNNKSIRYEFFISRDPENFDTEPKTDLVEYPLVEEDQDPFIVFDTDILPNTVYYIKARATLIVDGDEIGHSVDTAIKTITTPKIDDGGLDNDYRDPRAPAEFSIAVDADGELLLTDAWVTLNWVHAEKDVTYEMVCTSTSIPAKADEKDYENDAVNIGFLQAYNDFRNPAGDNKIHIDVDSIILDGFTVNSETGQVLMPIRRNFLRPNRIYFFSLRAVRNRGKTEDDKLVETTSRWITIPVTTRMVKPPGFIEAVKDMEVGFNIESTAIGATADSMEVYLKKPEEANSSYVLLNRAEYSCVQDGTTFYFRIYNLEPDQWYDIQVKNKDNGRWYDNNSETWVSTRGTPVKEKTRDALSEIEIRFEGEDPYDYFLEIRTDNDAEYRQLVYRSGGQTDYGYETESGRIEFYREKTRIYVEENSPKYVYYARIRGAQVPDEHGVLEHQPLKSNTLYYVKLWAYNLEESLHIGPVTARTDFSQDDYDKDKKEDNVVDLFNNAADKLTQKLYWRIDIKNDTTVRVLLKDDRIQGLLKASRESTVTVDISGEQANTSYYEVLIPYKTLEAMETHGSRLNIKILGAEFTLNKGSIDLADLKAKALSSGAKEAMLLLKINRRQSPKNSLPGGATMISKAYELQTVAVGSRRTYEEISNMLFNILKNPDARGPFKYGIIDRELTVILNNLASYSYKSHIDLKDMINTVINKVEIELSRYLKDIIDGGSGLTADYVVSKVINDLPGRIGVNLEYTYRSGYVAPFVNYGSGFKEPDGGKGYVMQYVLFRAEKPGEYLVINKGEIIAQPGPTGSGSYSFLSSRYDLTKVFGQGTIYPANPISGEQAVMLYAVVTRREGEITGMTPAQKASKLGIGDIIGRSQLTGYMDNQSSVSMAVKLYCTKANINPDFMKPSRVIIIENGSDINSRLYPYVTLGVDMELITLNNNRFDATERTTIGNMLDMISKALEKLN